MGQNTMFADATLSGAAFERKKRRASFMKGAKFIYQGLRDAAIWYLIYHCIF